MSSLLRKLSYKSFRSIVRSIDRPIDRFIVSKLRAACGSQAGSKGVFAETTCIACPLCGTNKPFSQEVFNDINLERFRIIRSTNSELKPGGSDKSKDIFLSEIVRRKDLGWLKRQVIIRCIEIIKKLAV